MQRLPGTGCAVGRQRGRLHQLAPWCVQPYAIANPPANGPTNGPTSQRVFSMGIAATAASCPGRHKRVPEPSPWWPRRQAAGRLLAAAGLPCRQGAGLPLGRPGQCWGDRCSARQPPAPAGPTADAARAVHARRPGRRRRGRRRQLGGPAAIGRAGAAPQCDAEPRGLRGRCRDGGALARPN